MHPNMKKLGVGVAGALSAVAAQAQLPSPWREIVLAVVAIAAAWWQASPAASRGGAR